MSDKRDLRYYVVPPGRGASFRLLREGGLILIKSLSSKAADWLDDQVGGEASWHEGALVIEQRYLPELVEAMIDAVFYLKAMRAMTPPIDWERATLVPWIQAARILACL